MKKLLILLIIILLTGCSRYTELNELAITKSIGITYQEDNYILYAEIIDKVNKDNTPVTKIVTVEGKTVEEVFTDIKLSINKEIHLSHIDLIILSDTLNDNNYQEIIKYFIINKDLRNDYLTILSNDITEILANANYDEIEELIKTNKDSKNIINVSFQEIMQSFIDYKTFKAPYLIYDQEIKFTGNYQYLNNKLERINNEK